MATEKTTQPVPLEFRDLGVMPYSQALDLQMELCLARQNDEIDNTVLIVEHRPVITLGARKTENKLLAGEDVISNAGIELLQVGRGGGCTAHNPGQLVVYPILKLKTLKLDITNYIRSLETIGIDLLASFDVQSERRKGFPGLWIGDTKIASIGVQLKKWVTFHGMAINISNDLGIFNYFVPCGLDNVVITSAAKQTGRNIDMNQVKDRLRELCLKQWSVC
jgi:lipoate-protein ligase B